MMRGLCVKEELTYRSIADEIIKTIKYAFDAQKLKYDRTYKCVIEDITPKGYVIEKMGIKKTVKCCIPGLVLKPKQIVWVKEPMGNIQDMHICGVV